VGWKGGGGFRFQKLTETVFMPGGSLNPKVTFKALAAHVWWRETGKPLVGQSESPLLGVHEGTAIYLLYNGILGDRRPAGGNILTLGILKLIPEHSGPRVIFAEAPRITEGSRKRLGIRFRQIPYDLGGLHA
jgi:adenine-specific DNA-methyltransferase